MDRRLLIPTVAAVHGSDLVWNQLTLHLAIHMKIQSQTLAGQRENPALCLRKKRDLLVQAELGLCTAQGHRVHSALV